MKKHVEIAEKAYWVGYVDNRKVPFHRLVLEKGTTYNAYLLDTEKPTLIDTVDIEFGKTFVENLSSMMDLEKLEYVVINHVEPDHAGGLPALMSKAKNAKIVTTALGAEELKNMFRLHNREFVIVHDGMKLDIGGKTLQFVETPFLHTEETMVTYCIEDKILYPCDQFSSHVATYELFEDLTTESITEDFNVYYQLIMHPHRPYVQDMIKKIRNLDIQMIAPSHGYILRRNVGNYINAYDEMSRPKENKKAAILFSTMTGNTTKIAKGIAAVMEQKSIKTRIMNVGNADLGAVIDVIKESDAVFFGSSTRYADMVGKMEPILKELKHMDLSSKLAVAFGSYGWSGEAVEVIQDYLKDTNMKTIDRSYLIKATGMDNLQVPIRIKFSPEGQEEQVLYPSVRAIADLLIG
ncbi:FprA family A-type flavoprotein [Geosporobacter ferrireducens]|uniref:Flavoprotein n=1 Tax=Geosporobacter ferrireducens TaxID=1424294 RepID=A0A1D8GDQ6_9FIRM|nr:FprA family A-type flavoprotein [Geosporobacter ferrireducens]AOT69037.1 flavoprotein [Geosporobacter ferrireducens]MTI56704.1 FprA family A-type flavoprotein [Geosporobacter ferrireducens]